MFMNTSLPSSAWEPAPFLQRWRGKERHRVSRPIYFMFVYHIGYRRVWEYR